MPRDRRQRRSHVEWVEILRRFQASGLGRREFCRREGLALSSFQRWQERVGRSSRRKGFVELVPGAAPSASSPSWELQLSLPNGVCLRLRG